MARKRKPLDIVEHLLPADERDRALEGLTPDERDVFRHAFWLTTLGPVLRPRASARQIAAAGKLWKKLQGPDPFAQEDLAKVPNDGDWQIWQHHRDGWKPDALAVDGSPVFEYLNGNTDPSRKTEVIRRKQKVDTFRRTAPRRWFAEYVAVMRHVREDLRKIR